MDDLIIILVRAFARWLSGPPQRRPSPPQRQSSPPPANPAGHPNLPPAWQEQVRRAMAAAQRPAKGKPRRPAPPPLPPLPPVTIIQTAAPAPIAAPAHASTRQGPGTARADLRHWLTPAVLQKQFILSEVLQPPLALREK
jgi:hypothetical protein